MKITEEFLAAYKDYEQAVYASGKDPKELEGALEASEGQRLTICRQMRNYLSHSNDPGFLEPSKQQVAFLKKMAKEAAMECDVLKNYVQPASRTLSLGMPLSEALDKFTKFKVPVLLVVDGASKQPVGTVDMYAVMKTYRAQNCGIIGDIKLGKDYKCMSPASAAKDVPRYTIVACTQDGTPNSKLTGVLYPEFAV